jgi:hypothetical protein
MCPFMRDDELWMKAYCRSTVKAAKASSSLLLFLLILDHFPPFTLRALCRMPLVENLGSNARDFCMLERNLLAALKLTCLLCLVFASILLRGRLSINTHQGSTGDDNGVGNGNGKEEDPHRDTSLSVAAIQFIAAMVVIVGAIHEYHSGVQDLRGSRAFLRSDKYVWLISMHVLRVERDAHPPLLSQTPIRSRGGCQQRDHGHMLDVAHRPGHLLSLFYITPAKTSKLVSTLWPLYHVPCPHIFHDLPCWQPRDLSCLWPALLSTSVRFPVSLRPDALAPPCPVPAFHPCTPHCTLALFVFVPNCTFKLPIHVHRRVLGLTDLCTQRQILMLGTSGSRGMISWST